MVLLLEGGQCGSVHYVEKKDSTLKCGITLRQTTLKILSYPATFVEKYSGQDIRWHSTNTSTTNENLYVTNFRSRVSLVIIDQQAPSHVSLILQCLVFE